MSRSARAGGPAGRALCFLAALVLSGVLGVGLADGERAQRGDLIVSLDGEITPLRLPRDRRAPVAVHVDAGLRTADGSLLPRVTRIELGLPAQGAISTRGLPVCAPRRLRNAKPAEALAACGSSLIGRGNLESVIVVPQQDPFPVRARLLAFNGRVDGQRAVLLHSYSSDPPTVAVVLFLVRPGTGRFGTTLVASLPSALGPWPHLVQFRVTLFRRFADRGEGRSYLSASCPLPPSLAAGFFSLARVTFSLVSGRKIGVAIARGCRAR